MTPDTQTSHDGNQGADVRFINLITKFKDEAPAKKNTMPFDMKAKLSQNPSKVPDSSNRELMSNLEVAAPYRPYTATEITPEPTTGDGALREALSAREARTD
jgi:hypothetical protein